MNLLNIDDRVPVLKSLQGIQAQEKSFEYIDKKKKRYS